MPQDQDYDYSNDTPEKIEEYLKKISDLNEDFDEANLQRTTFPKNFRCKSIIQSYNIFDTKDYFGAQYAMWRANKIIDTYLKKRGDDDSDD